MRMHLRVERKGLVRVLKKVRPMFLATARKMEPMLRPIIGQPKIRPLTTTIRQSQTATRIRGSRERGLPHQRRNSNQTIFIFSFGPWHTKHVTQGLPLACKFGNTRLASVLQLIA